MTDYWMHGEELKFIETELNLAHAFLDVWQTSQIPESRVRNLGNARQVWDTVTELLEEGVSCTKDERTWIDENLIRLEDRINAAAA